jgi:hypothetical protein
VKLYDFCFKYLPVAEAKEQATKVMDGVFDNSLEKRAARGWWDENDYLERMPHIRKLLKGKGFTAQDSPYKGYAAMLLKAISKKRNLGSSKSGAEGHRCPLVRLSSSRMHLHRVRDLSPGLLAEQQEDLNSAHRQ